MSEVILKVLLPSNRDRTGTLSIEVDGRVVRTFKVLGRGSAGSGDTQFKHNGNTPTGLYEGRGWQDTSKKNQFAYGPFGAMILEPAAGNAMLAHSVSHRDLFRIHGGGLDPRPDSPWYGGLNPTNGCLRLRNEDIKILYSVLLDASVDEKKQVCTAPTVWVNVQEGVWFDDSDDGVNQCSSAPYSLLRDGGGITFRRLPQSFASKSDAEPHSP
jgi:hypothetical protein